jgi:hypothetical protein
MRSSAILIHNLALSRRPVAMKSLNERSSEDGKSDLMRLLTVHRGEIADAVARSFECIPRWCELAESHRTRRAEYVNTHFAAFADYLRIFLEGGDIAYRDLFIGESVKALYDQNADEARAVARATEVAHRIRRIAALQSSRKCLDTPPC